MKTLKLQRTGEQHERLFFINLCDSFMTIYVFSLGFFVCFCQFHFPAVDNIYKKQVVWSKMC